MDPAVSFPLVLPRKVGRLRRAGALEPDLAHSVVALAKGAYESNPRPQRRGSFEEEGRGRVRREPGIGHYGWFGSCAIRRRRSHPARYQFRSHGTHAPRAIVHWTLPHNLRREPDQVGSTSHPPPRGPRPGRGQGKTKGVSDRKSPRRCGSKARAQLLACPIFEVMCSAVASRALSDLESDSRD